MKIRYALAALAMIGATASAQTSHTVRGYSRSDGTYVPPHQQTDSNATKLDNYSTQGNVNPYNGRSGTVDPYKPSSSNPYGSPYNAPRSSTHSGY